MTTATAGVAGAAGVKQSSAIGPGERLGDGVLAKALEEFYREGFVVIRGVLTAGEVQALRDITDRAVAGGDNKERNYYVGPVFNAPVLRHTQSVDRAFCDMLVREPFLQIAEAILGPGFGFCGQNVIRSGKGTGISGWHVDDTVEFPLPEGVARHDARLVMPVQWFSFQIALSDIDGPEHGPTQIVPGSHYSGREVPGGRGKADVPDPVFEGRGPVNVYAKAGDIYIFNHQTWHRGSINTSDRNRYLMQNQYGRAWIHQRFGGGGHMESHLSEQELDGASDTLLRFVRRTKK
jgi:hypothetical protein